MIHSKSGTTEIRNLGGTANLEDLLTLSKIVLLQTRESSRDRRTRNDYDRRGPLYTNRRQNMSQRRRENVGRNG